MDDIEENDFQEKEEIWVKDGKTDHQAIVVQVFDTDLLVRWKDGGEAFKVKSSMVKRVYNQSSPSYNTRSCAKKPKIAWRSHKETQKQKQATKRGLNAKKKKWSNNEIRATQKIARGVSFRVMSALVFYLSVMSQYYICNTEPF